MKSEDSNVRINLVDILDYGKFSGTFKPAQAEFLIDELLRELRRQTTPKVHNLPDNVTFNEFLNLLQVIFPDREDLQIATDRVFERYVNHVIGKVFSK